MHARFRPTCAGLQSVGGSSHLRNVVRAAKTVPGGRGIAGEAKVLPSILVIPHRSPAGVRVALFDRGVGEGLSTDIVAHRVVGEQLDLRLVLLRASHVVLAWSMVHGRCYRRLELRKVELFEVARKDKGPHALQILRGQYVAHFEVGLGILVLGQPLVKGGPGITLDVLRHSGTHAKQGTGNDQQPCQRHILAPRRPSHPRFDRHNLFAVLPRARFEISQLCNGCPPTSFLSSRTAGRFALQKPYRRAVERVGGRVTHGMV